MSSEAAGLFEGAMEWLRQNYVHYRFFRERDIVWTLQLHIADEIEAKGMPFKGYNDYRIYKDGRRGWLPDLAILRKSGEGDVVEVTIDIKWEPSHARSNLDITPGKLTPSVVFWRGGSVARDLERAKEMVGRGLATASYVVCIDEGSTLFHRPPFPGSEWRDWGRLDSLRQVSVLWARFPPTP